MKLWDKKEDINEMVESFTIGKDPELDLRLAKFDILGTLAHIEMLCSIDLLTGKEFGLLKSKLKEIYKQVEAGKFVIEPGVEDVHSQIELMLTHELGDIGKKIHSGRSRNDQVLVDLRLYFRSAILEIVESTEALFQALLAKSKQNKKVLMPGYTHTQIAMVSSFGLWFSAFAESLTDDLRLLQGVYEIMNQNPLGSGAGFGSSFPLDRQMTTDLLGFQNLNYNSIHAQMGRGKTELYLSFGITALASTLGRFATDVCLYSSQNYGFIKLPDAYTTGSSIMPHKKNPDVFELIRARCNHLQTLPQQVTSICTNLMSGYHRDYQLLKELIFPAISQLKDCLNLAALCIPEIQVKQNILADEKYKLLYTAEAVNQLVKKGKPFRDAYHEIAASVEAGTFEFKGEIKHTHEGSIGNLCLEEIEEKMQDALLFFDFEEANEVLKDLLKNS